MKISGNNHNHALMRNRKTGASGAFETEQREKVEEPSRIFHRLEPPPTAATRLTTQGSAEKRS